MTTVTATKPPPSTTSSAEPTTTAPDNETPKQQENDPRAVTIEDPGPDLKADNIIRMDQATGTNRAAESEPVMIIRPRPSRSAQPSSLVRKKKVIVVEKKVRKIDAAKVATSVSTAPSSTAVATREVTPMDTTIPVSLAFRAGIPPAFVFRPPVIPREEPPDIVMNWVPAGDAKKNSCCCRGPKAERA